MTLRPEHYSGINDAQPKRVGTKAAYVVDPTPDGKHEIWDQVGSASVFDDGQIVLQLWALPITGRVVLVDGDMPRVVALTATRKTR
jgi:hypothetical protein